MMMQTRIHVRQFKKSGLFVAQSYDQGLEGFIVHAHTIDELPIKLKSAFEYFMAAIGKDVTNVRVTEEGPDTLWPPAYIAEASLEKDACVP